MFAFVLNRSPISVRIRKRRYVKFFEAIIVILENKLGVCVMILQLNALKYLCDLAIGEKQSPGIFYADRFSVSLCHF